MGGGGSKGSKGPPKPEEKLVLKPSPPNDCRYQIVGDDRSLLPGECAKSIYDF
jgi:hypothetical protein